MTKLVIIAARDRNSVIGLNNQLPWHLPEDLAYFKRITTGKPVIMGRKTHESIGFALPGRENIIVTTKATAQFRGCLTAGSLEAAIEYCKYRGEEEMFLIGGATLYEQALPKADKLLITEIDREFEGDAFFPAIRPTQWTETRREDHASGIHGIKYSFVTYEPAHVVQERQQAEQAKRLLSPQERWTSEFLAQMLSHRSIHKNKGTTMKTYKHPGHILAIDKDFTDNLPGMGLTHGLTRLSAEEYKTWLSIVGAETVIRQRDGLEANPFYRQLLPYSPVVFQDDEAFRQGLPINWDTDEISSYQRTKKVGEERLGGKFSVGYGGHVDHLDVKVNDQSVLDIETTINTNLQREVANEELIFVDADGLQATPLKTPSLFRFEHLGFIRDDSDNVGKVHLGLVNLIVVPKSLKAKVAEEELIDGPRGTVKELLASGLKFENWSRIVLEALAGVDSTVEPSQVRPAIFDPVTHQYYIEAKEGDKITELAIEFHTTVAQLRRMNLHLLGSGSIPAGLRVNVPQPDDELPMVSAPHVTLEAVSNVTNIEDARARLTVKVLQMVLALTGDDLADHSMRYYVTEDMAARLLKLDERVQALIDAKVVIVVASDTPVVINGNLNISGGLVGADEPTL
jgi:dihydrofolate reductase